MRLVFVVEPFGDPELFTALLGEAPMPVLEAACLPDHEIHADESGIRLSPLRSPGAEASGWVIKPDELLRKRIEFWMATTGAQVRVAKVRVNGRIEIVDTYLLSMDQLTLSWTWKAWDGEWRLMVAEAIREALRHLFEVEPQDMPELLPGIGYRALARARGAADRTAVGLRAGLSAQGDIELLRQRIPYTKYFAIEEHLLRHRRFDGQMSTPLLRAAFSSGDAVTVLPFDPRMGSVLLIEQFRAGPLARKDPRPWCLETVAGRCDALEEVEATARREALEEAGLKLGRVERIGGYYPSPGAMAEHITAFIGEADLREAGGFHGLESEGEDIRSLVLPLTEALAAVESGEINNAPLLISLLWLEKHADRLIRIWV